jgi:ribose/xylose/arabinose/galactoside ABC-type transport system permease subunit
MKSYDYIKKKAYDYPIILFLVAIFIYSAFVIPYFFSVENLVNILGQSSDITIAAIGIMFVILNGGIDFSITAVMGFGSVLGTLIMNKSFGFMKDSPYAFLVAIIVMISVGLIIGVINGFSVVVLKMPSFIATMATSMVFSGLALYIANSKPINDLPKSFLFIANGKVFGAIPFQIILMVIVVIFMQILLSKTVFGRNVYAIGTNQKTATISGIPVGKTIFKLFLISGVLSAVGGIVSTSTLGAGMPALNSDRMLDFVTAAILGGTSVYGGTGTVLGTFGGAIFMVTLNNALSMMGLQWFTIMTIKGSFLLLIALFDVIKMRKA